MTRLCVASTFRGTHGTVQSCARRRGVALLLIVLGAVALSASGCDRWYYGTMKKFGMEKRDILVKRVTEARKSQVEARDEFKTALERFKTVIDVDGGPLEDKYEKLDKELKRAEDRAKEVDDRIHSIKDVSDDLLKEWDKELKQYSDKSLRAESERELEATRKRCESLIRSMEKAQKKIAPVMAPLRDRVLFLKHNLNAQAIGALDAELVKVRTDVDALVADLEASIQEAEAFLSEFKA
jgi:chromosome segregation ATPase